ncbi:BZ3500_MvSof-1268-A1-R1_Chr11-3g03496 [Microbotryum saponariae]|uniref:BZ3500_MvSof-1268-A1-R1_Chr11-3g03496 protein n=1 Tax=Microbotryum saponariae TaxID=289078 RepID=A0A2X0LEZ8_9BASI|nr:BZ3500_MvSof-1268-A1-R1_Chr11-3g03496 [Microbotryum saponariae]SDA03498.1 BZ3501_MvSof-1269-A2-R1_Chr11g03073 [Microbotryum saponariae]
MPASERLDPDQRFFDDLVEKSEAIISITNSSRSIGYCCAVCPRHKDRRLSFAQARAHFKTNLGSDGSPLSGGTPDFDYSAQNYAHNDDDHGFEDISAAYESLDDFESNREGDVSGSEDDDDIDRDWRRPRTLAHMIKVNAELVKSSSHRASSSSVPHPSDEWFPFPSAAMCVVSLFWRSPHRRMGVQEFQEILEFAQVLGVTKLPSIKTIKTFLCNLLDEIQLFRPRPVVVPNNRTIFIIPPSDFVIAPVPSPDARSLISPQALATPTLVEQLEFYPSYDDKDFVQSACQTARWRHTLPAPIRTPMASHDGIDYFAQEIVLQRGGGYLLIDSFATHNHVLCALAVPAVLRDDGSFCVQLPPADMLDLSSSPLSDRAWSLMPLELLGSPIAREVEMERRMIIHREVLLPCLPASSASRAAARGGRLLTSKRYYKMFVVSADSLPNTHVGYYIVLIRPRRMQQCSIQTLGLPTSHLSRRFSLQHIAVTAWGEALDLAEAVLTDIIATLSSPVEAIDGRTGAPVQFLTPLLYTVHDTPMAAEVSARPIGAAARFPCRCCRWAGYPADRLAFNTLRTYFTVSHGLTAFASCSPIKRNAESTMLESWAQIETMTRDGTAHRVQELQRSTGTRDKVTAKVIEEIRQAYAVEMTHKIPYSKDGLPQPNAELARMYQNAGAKERKKIATANGVRARAAASARLSELKASGSVLGPFFRIPHFDVHRDTPPDMLHVLLLGPVKCLWVDTMAGLTPTAVDFMRGAFRSLSTAGLGERFKPNFYVDYKGSLDGHDSRMIAQILPFIAEVMLSRSMITPVTNRCSLGKLTHHMFTPSAISIDQYADDYRELARAFVQASMTRNLTFTLARVKC